MALDEAASFDSSRATVRRDARGCGVSCPRRALANLRPGSVARVSASRCAGLDVSSCGGVGSGSGVSAGEDGEPVAGDAAGDDTGVSTSRVSPPVVCWRVLPLRGSSARGSTAGACGIGRLLLVAPAAKLPPRSRADGTIKDGDARTGALAWCVCVRLCPACPACELCRSGARARASSATPRGGVCERRSATRGQH
jgi:hypothetical protein